MKKATTQNTDNFTTASRITFTFNNWTREIKRAICEYKGTDCNLVAYLVVGEEIAPTTGTPHLQGYWEFEKSMRKNTLLKLFPGIKLFMSVGTGEQNLAYCSKDNVGVFIKGAYKTPVQGKRNDLVDVIAMVKKRESITEIAKTHPLQYLKYERGIRALNEIYEPHRTEKPECIWLWGLAGVGKTHYPLAKHGEENVFVKDEAKWWGSYAHEIAVCIDDFDHNEWTFRRLLRLIDKGRYEGETKGSHIKINSKFMYITCEYPPSKIWQGNKLDQVTSRFDLIIEVKGKCLRKEPKYLILDNENNTIVHEDSLVPWVADVFIPSVSVTEVGEVIVKTQIEDVGFLGPPPVLE